MLKDHLSLHTTFKCHSYLMQYWVFFFLNFGGREDTCCKISATGLSPSMLEAWKGSGSCLGPLSLILQWSFNSTDYRVLQSFPVSSDEK